MKLSDKAVVNFLVRRPKSISLWKRFISYVYPIHIDSQSEPYYLELILDKNVLKLHSLSANQSNESLKEAFKLLFYDLKIPNKNIEKILILGFGLGSIIDLLNNDNQITKVISYENNPTIINYLKEHYYTHRIELKNKSAKHIDELDKFDLIVVDLFQDIKTPDFLNSESYWSHLKSFLNEKGIIIWNTLIEHPPKTRFHLKETFDNSIEVLEMNRFWVYKGNP